MPDTLTAAWIEGETVALSGVAAGKAVRLHLSALGTLNLIEQLIVSYRQLEAARARLSDHASGSAPTQALTTDDPYPDRIGADGE